MTRALAPLATYEALEALLAIAEAFGWPRRRLGRNWLATEASWRAALEAFPPLSPPTRARLARTFPAWATPPLVATPGARARLAAWVRAPRRRWDRALEARRREIEVGLAYYGDAPILDLVVDVVARLPAPVREFALAECAVLGVGWTTRGFTGPSLPATGPLARPRVIVLDGASRDPTRLRFAIAHELAHGWLKGPPTPETAPHGPVPAAALRVLEAAWRENEQLDEFVCLEAAEHRRVERLVAAWGFVDAPLGYPNPHHPAPRAPRRSRR